MDSTLEMWSVASSSAEAIQSDFCRLEVYEGELISELLRLCINYLERATSGPMTALIRTGLRYTELDLPSVRSKGSGSPTC